MVTCGAVIRGGGIVPESVIHRVESDSEGHRGERHSSGTAGCESPRGHHDQEQPGAAQDRRRARRLRSPPWSRSTCRRVVPATQAGWHSRRSRRGRLLRPAWPQNHGRRPAPPHATARRLPFGSDEASICIRMRCVNPL